MMIFAGILVGFILTLIAELVVLYILVFKSK